MALEAISNRTFFVKNQWAGLKQAIAVKDKDEAIKLVAYLILFSEKNLNCDLKTLVTNYKKMFELNVQLETQKNEIEDLKVKLSYEKRQYLIVGNLNRLTFVKVIEDWIKTKETCHESTKISFNENMFHLSSHLCAVEENPLFKQAKALAVQNVEQRLKCPEMQPPLPRLKQTKV